jgi:hypothetical protein
MHFCLGHPKKYKVLLTLVSLNPLRPLAPRVPLAPFSIPARISRCHRRLSSPPTIPHCCTPPLFVPLSSLTHPLSLSPPLPPLKWQGTRPRHWPQRRSELRGSCERGQIHSSSCEGGQMHSLSARRWIDPRTRAARALEILSVAAMVGSSGGGMKLSVRMFKPPRPRRSCTREGRCTTGSRQSASVITPRHRRV